MIEDSNPDLSKETRVSLFDAFDLLKSSTEDSKINGAAKIVTRLQGSKIEKDVKYALRRLIRSLGANVPEMRIGYFATLVSLFNRLEEITVKEILDIIRKELHASGSSKSEVGDVSLGQILVCGAIFRSKLFFKCDADGQKEIIQLLQKCGNKKSYLNAVAYNLLLDLANRVNEEQFAILIWPNIKQDFKKEIKEYNLDSLHFLSVVSARFPQKIKLRKLIGVPELLHDDVIPDICEKLMSGIDFQSSGHPIYAQIGKDIAVSPHLELFWTKIDSFLVKHNRNRELAALNILNSILLNLQDGTQIPVLLSENFLKLFMDWFKGLQTASKIRNKKDEEDDHKIMVKKGKETLTSLTKALKLSSVDGKLRVAVLKKLLLSPGEINFTEITGSNIIKTLIADLDVDGLKKLAKIFRKILLNTLQKTVKENVERKWYNNERVKAAELLSFIVCHEEVKDDIEFKISNMQLLMCLAFFKIGGEENVAVSTELAGSIKTCFYRCFTTRFSNVDNLVTVLSSLSGFVSKIIKKEQIFSKLEKQFSKKNMECWETHVDICNKIEEENTKTKVDKVFLILLHQLGLFLFSEPTHVKISQSCITELKSCYEHYKKGQKVKRNIDTDVDQEPEWIEVVIEVLLSILSVDSSVLRSVVQCVFRLLCENLTSSCMGQIVSVLDPESESNPLSNDSDSDEEPEDKTDSIHSKSVENGECDGDGESEEESNESDSDVENEDDEAKTPEQLRIAVQKALGSAVVPDSDAESLDADMITEEEGQKLDEALAEAFRQFHEGKSRKSKKDRKNKKALSDFRIRVLDLIDIYVEKDPQMDICLSMILPLTKALEFCLLDNQFHELEKKIRKTLKNLTKIRKFSSTGDVTTETLSDFLQSIIEKRNRSQFMYQALGDIITCSATFIINCSQKLHSNVTKSTKKQKPKSSILTVLREATENFFKSRNCLLPIIFFHKVLQIEWIGVYDLVEIIVDNIFNDNIRQFRRNEGLELMIGYYRALCRYKPNSKEDIAKILHIENQFNLKFIETFEKHGTVEKVEVKKNFLVTLRKLINIIKMYHENSKVVTNLNFKTMTDVLSSVKSTIITKTVQPQANNNQNKKNKKRKMLNGDSKFAKKIKKTNGIEISK